MYNFILAHPFVLQYVNLTKNLLFAFNYFHNYWNQSIKLTNLHKCYILYLGFMNNIKFLFWFCVYSSFLQKTCNTLNKNQSYYILNICNCTVYTHTVNNNILEYNCISIIASQIYIHF